MNRSTRALLAVWLLALVGCDGGFFGPNDPPRIEKAESIPVDGDIAPGTLVRLSVAATDPDRIGGTPPRPFTYSWEAELLLTGTARTDGRPLSQESDASSHGTFTTTDSNPSFWRAPEVEGSYRVKFTVCDDDGGCTDGGLTFRVTRTSTVPIATIAMTPDPQNVAGYEKTLVLAATPPSGVSGLIDYRWRLESGEEGLPEEADGPAKLLNDQANPVTLETREAPHRYIVRVDLFQDQRLIANGARLLEVRNRPPVISGIGGIANPGLVPAGRPVTLTALFSDPDEIPGSPESATFQWEVSAVPAAELPADCEAGGLSETRLRAVPWTPCRGRTGYYTLKLTVTDGYGAGATHERPVRVSDEAPAVSSFLIGPVPVRVGIETTLTLVVDDPEGDHITYTWGTSPPNGHYSSQSDGVAKWVPSASGTTAITVGFSDGAQTGSHQFNFEVKAP